METWLSDRWPLHHPCLQKEAIFIMEAGACVRCWGASRRPTWRALPMEAPSRSWSPVRGHSPSPRLPLRAWPGGCGTRVPVKPDHTPD